MVSVFRLPAASFAPTLPRTRLARWVRFARPGYDAIGCCVCCEPPEGVKTPLSNSAIVSSAAPDPAHAAEPFPHSVSDAASLFREATAARHAADFGRARALYLRLESEFPASPEAQLAHVSLGKVLLSMGRASEAEQQFAVYLRVGGGLTEEALVGRAQSLARLGRGDDERRVWETPMRQFPSSVYAVQARDRLDSRAESRP
jgi:TolA-binding protein